MGKYNRPRRGGPRGRQSARTGALEIFFRPEQTWLGRIVSLLIRLRVEITLLVTVTVILWWLSRRVPDWAFYTVLIGALAVLAGVGPVRRYVVARFWCVLTRHRVRTCFEQTRTMTHNGKLPSLMWSRPSPIGERVRVWLPAGLSVKHLEHVCPELATACWARDARIEANRGQAASAMVHIIRRDPLANQQVDPDLLGDIGTDIDADDYMSNVVALPSRDEITAELDADQSAPATGPAIEEHTTTSADRQSQGSRATPRRGQRQPQPINDTYADPPVKGFGGMDVSDYV